MKWNEMKWGLVEMNKSEMNLWTAVLTFHSCHCLTLMRPVHDIHTGLFLCGLVSDSIYHDHDRSLDQNCLDFRCHRADKFSLCSMNDYNVYVDHCSYATNFGAYACTSFTFNKIARISCVVDIENTHTHMWIYGGLCVKGFVFDFISMLWRERENQLVAIKQCSVILLYTNKIWFDLISIFWWLHIWFCISSYHFFCLFWFLLVKWIRKFIQTVI